MDTALFGGCIAALNILSEEGTKKKISSITTGDSLIIFKKIPETPLIVIGRSRKLNAKKMDKILKQICITFKKHYFSAYCENFDGDISVFEKFGTQIEKIVR